MTKQTTTLLIIIFTIYSGIFAYNYTLNVDLMEARNFVTAREMVKNHNWLVPTMNGETRIAKPPLPTWLTAVAMNRAGSDINLMYNRIPAGAAALLTVAFLFLFVRSFSGRFSAAAFSAMALATSYMFMFMARKGTWDIFCHAFMMGAVWTLYEGIKREDKGRLWFVSSGILMALSWMSKGPVSFYTILLPFLLSLPVLTGFGPIKARWKGLLITIITALILSLLWPAYLYFSVPETAKHVVSGEVQAWGSRHIKVIWYYIQFPVMSGIWIVPALAFLWPPYAAERTGGKRPYIFLLAWILLEVLLLTIVPEKKDRYLLPVAITMAIPIGLLINSFTGEGGFERAEARFYRYLSMLFLAVSAVAGAYLLIRYGFDRYTAGFSAAALILLAASVKFKLYQKLDIFVMTALSLSLMVNTAAPLAQHLVHPKDFMELIGQRDSIKADVIYSGNDNMKVVWAAGKQIKILTPALLDTLKPDKDYYFISKREDKLPSIIKNKPFTFQEIKENNMKDWHLYTFRRDTE